ncbi:MAG: hypothetical protein ABSB19_09915 [Methylomonas sp.]|jgi:hypothetical protein
MKIFNKDQRAYLMSTITQQIQEEMESLPPEMQEEALDFVRFLKTKLEKTGALGQYEPNGTKAVAIMEAIAARGTAFKDIGDPTAWQREIRQDRPLPGRE